MSELARFEDAFVRALAGDETALSPWGAAGAPGLSVYRNTVAKGLADALAASFPTVERLVGADWFRAAALEFARAHPPAEPALAAYGAGFPSWLAVFPPAAGLPYLGEIARADRAWTEAHLAPDAAPLAEAAFVGLDAEALVHTRAVLHPSVRLLAFAGNFARLWLANRPSADPPADFVLEAEEETLLIARPWGVVESRRLGADEHAFLAACRDGASLAEAAAAALSAEPGADLAALIISALAGGLFVCLQSAGED